MNNVIDMEQHFREVVAQRDAQFERVSRFAVERDKPAEGGNTGGNSGGGSGMDQRIINLEQGMTDVKVSLGRVEVRLDNIEKDMFTKGQAAAYALVAVLGVLGGGWWVVQQYLSPLLAAAAAQ